jgi:hypothetical protein
MFQHREMNWHLFASSITADSFCGDHDIPRDADSVSNHSLAHSLRCYVPIAIGSEVVKDAPARFFLHTSNSSYRAEDIDSLSKPRVT